MVSVAEGKILRLVRFRQAGFAGLIAGGSGRRPGDNTPPGTGWDRPPEKDREKRGPRRKKTASGAPEGAACDEHAWR